MTLIAQHLEPLSAADGDTTLKQQRRDQMLKLVSKGFYNELINYGVQKGDILKVASHLLDNLLAQERNPGSGIQYYNQLFTLDTVEDAWQERQELVVQHVALRPLRPEVVAPLAEWLKNPVIRDSFVPAYPDGEAGLHEYFAHRGRDYFGIYYEGRPVGIVGGENLDRTAAKLEMKKLVGEPGLRGKGIGKRATFAFLYYAFMILEVNKVYIHSRDINIRNINLNSRFGFELEGIFLEDIAVGDRFQDVVRMALFKPLWSQIFSSRP